MMIRGGIRQLGLAVLSVCAAASLLGPVQVAQATDSFQQCANEGGDCNWINGILQPNNSAYAENMSTPQRLLLTNIAGTTGNVHTLTFDHEATKGGEHAYDWLTSYAQAITTAAAVGLPFNDLNGQSCDDLSAGETTTCIALRDGANCVDIDVPDDPFTSKDGSTQTRINGYEAAFGNRTIRLCASSAISGGSLTLSHNVANGADTGDSEIDYVLTWTSSSAEYLLQFGAHLSVGGALSNPISWGVGLGASSVSGGPYHVSMGLLDGSPLGSEDNQIMSATIVQLPTPTPTSTNTNTPTNTPTDTPTNTPTDTPTNTPTNTPTDTPTNTPTDTPTNTPTDTPTNTPTDTPTDTPTETPTDTPTETPTDTPTATPTETPTNTPTATVTNTPSDEICRTGGFWATHAGTEKGAVDLTLRALQSCDGDCVEICGEKIDNTTLNSANSAEEALCVNVGGTSSLQLARQLLAASLNCGVSGGPCDCSESSIATLFSNCDAVCQDSTSTQTEISDCIDAIDCFNNGGVLLDDGFCQTGSCTNGDPCNDKTPCVDLSLCVPTPGNCHDRDLPSSICNKATESCSASSSKKCNDANQNSCTVVGAGEATCADGLKCTSSEDCGQTCCPAGEGSPQCP